MTVYMWLLTYVHVFVSALLHHVMCIHCYCASTPVLHTLHFIHNNVPGIYVFSPLINRHLILYIISNYAPTIYISNQAMKQHGCQQVLWLYGPDEQWTEVGAMNVFVYWQNEQGGTYWTGHTDLELFILISICCNIWRVGVFVSSENVSRSTHRAPL